MYWNFVAIRLIFFFNRKLYFGFWSSKFFEFYFETTQRIEPEFNVWYVYDFLLIWSFDEFSPQSRIFWIEANCHNCKEMGVFFEKSLKNIHLGVGGVVWGCYAIVRGALEVRCHHHHLVRPINRHQSIVGRYPTHISLENVSSTYLCTYIPILYYIMRVMCVDNVTRIVLSQFEVRLVGSANAPFSGDRFFSRMSPFKCG